MKKNLVFLLLVLIIILLIWNWVLNARTKELKRGLITVQKHITDFHLKGLEKCGPGEGKKELYHMINRRMRRLEYRINDLEAHWAESRQEPAFSAFHKQQKMQKLGSMVDSNMNQGPLEMDEVQENVASFVRETLRSEEDRRFQERSDMLRAEVDEALSLFAADANLDDSQLEETSRLMEETHKQIRDLLLAARENHRPFYEVRQEVDKIWRESHNRIRETLDEYQIPYFEEMLQRIPMPPPLGPPPVFPR